MSEKHYVNNADLIPEINKFKETGKMSEELGGMLMLIAKNYANRPRFINYTWKDDMIQDTMMTCCKYLKNYNTEKSKNPFGYISKICEHSFHNHCNKQRKHAHIKDTCFNNKGVILDDETLYFSTRALDYTTMLTPTNGNNLYDENFEEE